VVLQSDGNIINSGTIAGVGGSSGAVFSGSGGINGISITAAGNIINQDSSALIKGTKYGIALDSTLGSVLVTNYGSIVGVTTYGISDKDNYADTITNAGLISGATVAVKLGGGEDVLSLKQGSTLKGIVSGGSTDTVQFDYTSGTVSNISTEFYQVGRLSNIGNLTLAGTNVLYPTATFLNTGNLNVLTNLEDFGTVNNSGTIDGQVEVGGQFPVYYIPDKTSPVLDNEAGGLIESTGTTAAVGTYKYAGSNPEIVENAGTIENLSSNGVAISFASGLDNTLVVEAGSKIIGLVNGGTTLGATKGSVIELSGGTPNEIATISGIGSMYEGFYGISVASGSDWDIVNSTISNLTNSGTLTLDASDTLTPNVTISDAYDGTLSINEVVPTGADLNFENRNGDIIFSALSDLNGVTISGFEGGDRIDIANLAYDPNGSISLASGNTLVVVEHGVTNTFTLNPSADFSQNQDAFHISSDGFNGTDISETAVPCFLNGTQILTPTGERAIEALRIGDLIVNHQQQTVPIKWIGRRSYTAPLPENPDIIPVLIKANAIANQVPDKDLYLSPLHAILIDHFLVPAGALINDKSILTAPAKGDITYFHIETENHDVIIAHHMPAETFIDEKSRRMFDNSEEYTRLYPGHMKANNFLAAPRLEYGGDLERIRRQIALRAGVVLDHAQTEEVVGYLESADRTHIKGWAYAPSHPNVPLTLDIFNRNALIGRTVANIMRQDVKFSGFHNGRCGFEVTLPGPLPALQRHEISVRPSGSKTDLVGGPIVLDPGIAEHLIHTGGLQAIIDAAVKGAASEQQATMIGSILESAGKQIQAKYLSKKARKKTTSKRNSGHKPTVLFLDEVWPTITLDAGSNAIMSHITAFQSLGYEVAFCATSGTPQNNDSQNGYIALKERGIACFGHDGLSAEDTIRNFAASSVDVVYLHRLATASAYAGLVKSLAPDAYLIYALADLHHLRLERQATVLDRPDILHKAKAVKVTELWAMRLADCVITHSGFEAEYLRSINAYINVHVLPWHTDVRGSHDTKQERNGIAFIGGAGHAPNADAVMYLEQSIMPIVWATDPTIKCYIIGAGWAGPNFTKMDQRMIAVGHQSDLKPMLDAVRLTVAPMRFGAGLKGKVLDSLALSCPCVMSPIAAEGLDLGPHLQDIVGDSASSMAGLILKVYGDPKYQANLALAGKALVTTAFSEKIIRDTLKRILGLNTARVMDLAATTVFDRTSDAHILQ
jgi:hypothetical protein